MSLTVTSLASLVYKKQKKSSGDSCHLSFSSVSLFTYNIQKVGKQMKDLLLTKDRLQRKKNSLVVLFRGKRKVLSTGPLNGGLHTDLNAVFNLHGGKSGELFYGDTYEEHMKITARNELGLDPCTCTGIMTAANMANAVCTSLAFENLRVTAIVTGGIEVNAGRVGDKAFWHENNGIWKNIIEKNAEKKSGTINILLFIGANLTDGAIERTLVTCTEAKTAAIQELCICSRYSSGLATGSGTDGTIITADMESGLTLTEAGKHCKLGELIGRTVKAAVKEALFRQTGVNPDMQHNVFRRMERWGITAEQLWEYGIRKGILGSEDRGLFFQKADIWARESDYVLWAALEAHLLDEYDWELINKEELYQGERKLKSIYSAEASDADIPELQGWMLRQFWPVSHSL